MIWKNTKLNYGVCLGHYEYVRKNNEWVREFHIVAMSTLEGYPTKKKTFKFSSPQAAKKAGWSSSGN